MKRQFMGIIGLLVLAMAGATCSSTLPASSATASTPLRCGAKQFEIAVYHGPDAGLSLQGSINLQIEATGALTGTFRQTSGQIAQVVGQANGRALHLLFTLADGKNLFGVGTLQEDIHECKGAVGGPLVGPDPADSGSWGFGLGG